MAVQVFGTNDPLTNKLYSKRLAVQSITQTHVKNYMGTSQHSLCQVRNETSKAAGDRVTIGLRMSFSGAGVVGGSTLEGNEENFTTYNDAITIDKLRHAARVKAAGSISQQRVPFDLREEALDDLSQWWADRFDFWFANQLSGNTANGDSTHGDDIRYTGLQASVQPDSAHVLRFSDAATDTAISSLSGTAAAAAELKLAHLDVAVEKAKRLEPLIRPVKVNGRNYYVMFVHTVSVTSLRSDAQTAGNWFDITSKRIQGGEITGNGIFNGSLGVYNQCILQEWERLPPGSSGASSFANARRNVFCGAQAAWAAFGQGFGPSRFSWVEKLFDYDEELGVAAGCIGGLKASRFDSKDFGKLVLVNHATAATDLGATS